MSFQIDSPFSPCGDQVGAIDALSSGVLSGKKSQVLLGVTGSGKTFTMAHIIQNTQRPALILAHNKTLAAQLYQEFKAFFPNNAVEYFVSYYDYYQPEAYIARTDTYIEKDLSINDQIDKMRLSATRSLIERRDVIVVASVSCIYGLGAPEYYREMALLIQEGESYERDALFLRLVEMQYERGDYDLKRGSFRVRGEQVEIMPAYESDIAYRITFFDDEVEAIHIIDPLTGRKLGRKEKMMLFPGSHHVTPEEVRERAIHSIKEELQERESFFLEDKQYVEHQRIGQRTRYDLEMIKEVGFCKGIENYSRHFSNRLPGSPPACLLDYFPEDFLLFVDESHQTIPQIHAMHRGDRARKESLVTFGFRLPSAYDNRPLTFEEFYSKIRQVVYVSATPAPWEIEESKGEVIEQVIRPTGLLDPVIEVRPAQDQVDDAIDEIRKETKKGGRVLVTTLTKKLSEDLTNYLKDVGVKAKYLHSDIDTIERMEIIKELREGGFEVLVGINLLREGLDIPEVTFIAILDADKEGFLRSTTALVQTSGRAARNAKGRVVFYADKITNSIQNTLDITQKRRAIQEEYNKTHGITPKTVTKGGLMGLKEAFFGEEEEKEEPIIKGKELASKIASLEKEMRKAAKDLQFEEAARLRDELRFYQRLELLEDTPV